MKAVAKTMVLVLLLGVMGASMLVFVSAAEDIPPAGYADAVDFAADEEMLSYSAAAQAAASLVISDATSVYVGSIENGPALRVDAYLVDTAADEADADTDDEDAAYEQPMAINDSPDTGRVSMGLAASVALIACALAPVVGRKK